MHFSFAWCFSFVVLFVFSNKFSHFLFAWKKDFLGRLKLSWFQRQEMVEDVFQEFWKEGRNCFGFYNFSLRHPLFISSRSGKEERSISINLKSEVYSNLLEMRFFSYGFQQTREKIDAIAGIFQSYSRWKEGWTFHTEWK